MLTTDQIRTLNDARTILKGMSFPYTWEGGRTAAAVNAGEHAVFQALNSLRAYMDVPISDEQMNNKETDMPAKYLGSVDEIEVRSDEAGFELHFATDDATYVVNVHARSRELLESVKETIGAYWDEADALMARYRARPAFICDPDESGGYDRSDPKHENWHSVHADLYDSREGK